MNFRRGVVLGITLALLIWASTLVVSAQPVDRKPSVPPPAKPGAQPAQVSGPVSATSPRTSDAPQVTYAKGLLSVKAEKADLINLLLQIAKATGLPVNIGRGVTGSVTVSFTGMKLEAGLARVLEAAGEKNLAIEYAKKPGAKKDEFTIEKISILRKVTPQEEAAALEFLEKQEREYRQFVDEMNKAGNKVARALKEYQDPGTSKRKKIDLELFLERTAITDTNDKKVLKGTLSDSQYQGDIVNSIQMALMHAIQRSPEESDKEYLLQALKRNDNRFGWLYYALLNVWDERYVPVLMEDLRSDPSPIVMEILGRQKVKAAIPVLEEIFRTSEMYSPEMVAALNAMTHIQGKRANIYDYRDRGGSVPVLKEDTK